MIHVARRVTIDGHLRFERRARNVSQACNHRAGAVRHVLSVMTDHSAQTVAVLLCNIVASIEFPCLVKTSLQLHL